LQILEVLLIASLEVPRPAVSNLVLIYYFQTFCKSRRDWKTYFI